MTEHILEMAKALVRIKDGDIEVLTDPPIRRCPLRRELYGIDEESRESVARVLKIHMQKMGMYGPKRVLELRDMPVSFGASEVLCSALSEGLVDAAVVVCEGAGTVVAARPDVLQAVGAHMTGLLSTEPIPEIQSGLEERGCLLLDGQASIDQLGGLEKAASAGYKNIAITVAGAQAGDGAAQEMRCREEGLGIHAAILAVHTTGIRPEQAAAIAESCDLVWSCASKAVREVVGNSALLQIGITIPVFALTGMGKRLILNHAQHFEGQLVLGRAYLPALERRQPEPLK